METLIVSEQQAEQTSGEAVSLSAGPAAPSDTPSAPVDGSAHDSVPPAATETIAVASPDLVPAQDAAPDAEAPKPDAAKAEFHKSEAPSAEAPRTPGKVLIM